MQRTLKTIFAFFTGVAALECKSDTGTGVDMWAAFKAPKGTDYAYMDPQTPLNKSKHNMNSTSVGALGETMQQLWSSKSVEYIIWNDEPLPPQKLYNFTTGHTKAVWAWDLKSGDAFILKHSVPLFPAGPGLTSKYLGLGSNAWMYGQNAACFSTSVDSLAALAVPLLLTVPSIYDRRISAATPASLAALANGAFSTDPVCSILSFRTRGGTNITYFGKSTQWNNELYSECIAPTLNVSLAVESWIRGSAEGPACAATEVLDIQKVRYPGLGDFSEYDDHSKWAVGLDTDWFCASDINRMTTQFKRGGGAYCWRGGLADTMRSVAAAMDSC